MVSFSYITKSIAVKCLVTALGLLMLGSCTKFPSKPGRASSASSGQSQSPYSMPAEAYLALAKNQAQGEQQNMLLLAAGRYIEDAQFQEAERLLTQITQLSQPQSDEKNILQARINVAHEQAQAAIARLSAVKQLNQLPQYYQIEYHEMLAWAYESVGNLSYALNERIKLDPLLLDTAHQTINRRNLWLSLTRLPTAELNTLSAEIENNPVLEGWIKLALIARESEVGKPTEAYHGVLAEMEQWQRDYPRHPANSLLPSPLSSAESFLHPSPHQIALLLPLTGPLSGPGSAVRDGFVAAYNEAGAPRRLDIKAYDTNGADIATLYQQAIVNGADYVVGPLAKPEVNVVAKQDHPVPTLLLNDTDVNLHDNAFMFGLSPSNEARQVAYRASKKGLHRVLIIAPYGVWGDDIVTAFSNQWRVSGGVVVDRLTYDDKTDLNTAVRDFLKVSARQASAKQFHVAGGLQNSSANAKRRQDFDMIFLLAYPSNARQIMPLLRYYFAGNVPVYATSTVYSGITNTMQDKDLDGIRFCDMSWVFSHQMPNKNWPESLNSYNRLYAMGMDSYALATELNRLILFPAMIVNNNTGVLYLNGAHQIGRILAWGQFRGGVAQLTSET